MKTIRNWIGNLLHKLFPFKVKYSYKWYGNTVCRWGYGPQLSDGSWLFPSTQGKPEKYL